MYITRRQNYGCILCGRCCRRFYVLLRRDEVGRLAALDWGGEQDMPRDFTEEIGGHPYFRRGEDGGCVFLDREGFCRMHRRFGFDRKALTCRGYPFNIVSTFPGEVSVLARMDCPAVLRNHGRPLREQSGDIHRLVSELSFGHGFTESQLQGLSRAALERLTAKCQSVLDDEALPMADCAKVLMGLATRVSQLGGIFLSDSSVPDVYPSLLKSLRDGLPDLPKYGFGPWGRSMFRQMMTAYCRRDEELLDRRLLPRARHAVEIARVVLGGGNLRRLGYEHPDFAIRKARLFRDWRKEAGAPSKNQRQAWECYRRFLAVRLECLQFFGVSYYGVAVFHGLQALFLTYPMALALARIHAVASRGESELRQEDVEYAVSAIDHCHGRSPALNFQTARVRERSLFPLFPQLVNALGCQ